LDRTLIDYAAIAFFFLRQPSTPNPTRPVGKSGSAVGRGTAVAMARCALVIQKTCRIKSSDAKRCKCQPNKGKGLQQWDST